MTLLYVRDYRNWLALAILALLAVGLKKIGCAYYCPV